MTRHSQGVRPWKEQRHLPESEVTAWEVDTAGALDANGAPLPRRRLKVEGSKAKAMAHRRVLLVQLERDALDPVPTPVEPTALVSAREIPRGSQIVSSRGAGITLRDFVRGPYRRFSRQKHKLTTHNNRMKNLEGYVLPALGKLSVDETNKPRSIDKLKDRLDLNPNLAVSTKQQVLLALSAVLTAAANPNAQPDGVALIDHRIKLTYYRDDTPRQGMAIYDEHGNRVGQSRHKRLEDWAWRDVVDACETDDELVLVGLGLWHGCRISEVGARRWTDADLSVPQVFIWSAVCPESNNITTLKKNNQGWVRTPQRMLEPLKRMREKARHNYILGVDKLGRPLDRDAVEHRYHLILRRTKVSRKNYHALRHTFCCRLADAGVPVHEIKQLARHADIETTYGYIEPSRENLLRATVMFDAD